MKILVLSEQAAIEKADNLIVPTSIISINEPFDDFVDFKKSNNLKNIFRMQFFDLEGDFKSIKAPEQNDFNGLKDFIDKLDCEELIIHCYAGVSRSAAVAAAVSQYLHIDEKFFNSIDYDPNLLVYRLTCNELNICPKHYNKNFSDDINIRF